MTELYNVYAVSLKNHTRRLIDEGLTKSNAEAVAHMAVIRRGVEEEIFVAELAAIHPKKEPKL